ncbi:MAG: DotU family type IV/VI secretion system protein [Acidobacteria bacterium]|nr:DotU family type IV/VI secretion system protein [Acidobacteriota bacterium]
MAYERSFLTRQFHEFYREVVRLTRRVDSGDWLFDAGGEAPFPAAAGDPATAERPLEARHLEERPAPSAVWQSLLTLLERQALAARLSGGDFAAEIYRQAQFVMAALGDEIFIHTAWPGKEAWKERLLEAELFGTHRAGERIFEQIDELLVRRDPIYLDLAQLYLYALALGFEGRYRDQEGGKYSLASYRRRLFNFISGRDPELDSKPEKLFPQTYAHTLDQAVMKRLPYLRPWLYGFAAMLLLWILIAHPVWRGLISDMEPAIRSILGT